LASGRDDILGRDGISQVRSLADLVGRFFRVPVAYAAMLGLHDRVVSCIGSGNAYWKYLTTLPSNRSLVAPMVIRDLRESPALAAGLGNLQFFASAPIGTLCAQNVGVLVIADRMARPEFSRLDLETLVEMAAMIACRIDLGVLVDQSNESQLRYLDAEKRFLILANLADTLIACHGADGRCTFVNDAWVKFTGRSSQQEMGDGWYELIQLEHRERILTLYWQALHARQPFTLDLPLHRHDGAFRWMRASTTPRFLNDATYVGFIVCLTEVAGEEAAAIDTPRIQ